MKHIHRILIANRSEIAQRIQHTAHTLGIQTVVVYTSQDAASNYVAQATYAVQLPGDDSKKYLCTQTLIDIAHTHGADAIHPGYGFLSESADFAQQVIDSGLIWIGPSPHTIEKMGDKTIARIIAEKCSIPIIPGVRVEAQSFAAALTAAQEIGFPLLIKCAHGGGGKAMRIAQSFEEFEQRWNSVVSESKRLFLSTTVLLERYISQSRHIEVQIIGDGKHCIHAYDRECSIHEIIKK